MPNISIAQTKIVRERLVKRIGESTESNNNTKELVEVLDMVIERPNLIKEDEKIKKVISDNRIEMQRIQESVKVKLEEGKQQIRDNENKVEESNRKRSQDILKNQASVEESKERADAAIAAYELISKQKIEDMKEEERKAEVRFNEIQTETDQMEAKLKAFKDKVANM